MRELYEKKKYDTLPAELLTNTNLKELSVLQIALFSGMYVQAYFYKSGIRKHKKGLVSASITGSLQ